jgi:glycosyltransferase involved in cell wall biosynthesis
MSDASTGARRIVLLTPLGTVGGAERVLIDMIVSLRLADPSLSLHAVVGTDGPLLERLREVGAEATLLPMPAALAGVGDSAMIGSGQRLSRLRLALRGFGAGTAAIPYATQLRRLVRRLRPDVVHSNGNKSHLLSRLALGRAWPVVWHLHDFLGDRPLLRRLARRATGGVRGAIAVSEAVARDARALLNNVPVEVIHNVVDTERFAPGPGDGERLDRAAGFASDGENVLRVGLVATYARWKGQDLFLEATVRLPPEVPARFYIIGGPIYQTAGSQFSEAELRARIVELGLQRRIGLVGFQADTPTVYRSLDVVVHASTRPEPFGLTIVEAMACGRPVIVTAAGGAAELFADGVDALGVPPGDASKLAAAIRALAGDAGLRSRLGVAARRTAVERFNRGRLGPQLLAAYSQFLR